MASITVASGVTRSKRRFAKQALRTAGIVALALVAGVGVAAWYVGRSLPRVSGHVEVAGATAPIEIVRDGHAVPHVFAGSDADAAFGLGYVHAQDRLWQLEQNRRLGSGTLAEVLGEDALEEDRFFRTLGFRRLAQENLARLSPNARVVLDAYAAGINAFLNGAGRTLPLEFTTFGFEPAAFRAVDSVVISKVMAWMSSGNFRRELMRVRLLQKLTAEQVGEFLGEDALPKLPFRELYGSLSAASSVLMARAPGPRLEAPIGSNSWVADGSRTESGKPLLANDPHLDFTAPSIWYLAHLRAPDLNVIGATIPGLPGVILGRTDHVAWSFTSTESDTQDLYIEKLDPDDPERYWTPGGPQPFTRIDERIRVKGRPDERLSVRLTRHGPVISDVYSGARGVMPDGHVLALEWAALRLDDPSLEFSLAAARARTAADLLAAARYLHSPPQNIVYADAAGSVGFVAAGRVPLRRDDALRGRVPVPGWLEGYEWTGFIPFEELPVLSAPPSGRIVTANHDIRPSGYQHWLGSEWALPYRAERIVELLDGKPKHDVQSFVTMQMDVRSPTAVVLLPLLLDTVPQDDAEREFLARLGAWNREMRPELPEPLMFAAWIRELAKEIYADELGELFDDFWRESPEFLRAVLSDQNRQARWCDDVGTAPQESCGERVGRALRRALAWLNETYGKDPRAWSWGRAHPAHSTHLPLGDVPLIGSWFDVDVPGPGDNQTVNVGGYSIDDEKAPFVSRYGAGFRAIYDLADLERSIFVISTGQVGHPLSPHYGDQSRLWSEGRYVPMTTRRDLVAQEATGTLTLSPQR